jgi:hypothetical protein
MLVLSVTKLYLIYLLLLYCTFFRLIVDSSDSNIMYCSWVLVGEVLIKKFVSLPAKLYSSQSCFEVESV